MDLALEGCSRILGLRALLWRNRTRGQNAYDTTCATPSHICKGQVVWAQLCGHGHKLQGMGDALDLEQDWADHRPISRSSVGPRRAGDCMMNES